jgi:hypothetical protein
VIANELIFLKTSLSILVTDAGIVIVVRPVPRNASYSNDCNCDPDSKITDIKLLQPEKALYSILVTDAGIVIVIRSVLAKAHDPIDSNCDPDSKIMDVKLLHWVNASFCIFVTDAGMMIVVSPVLMNALSPIDDSFVPDSKIIDVKLPQLAKASSAILVTDAHTLIPPLASTESHVSVVLHVGAASGSTGLIVSLGYCTHAVWFKSAVFPSGQGVQEFQPVQVALLPSQGIHETP